MYMCVCVILGKEVTENNKFEILMGERTAAQEKYHQL